MASDSKAESAQGGLYCDGGGHRAWLSPSPGMGGLLEEMGKEEEVYQNKWQVRQRYLSLAETVPSQMRADAGP